MPRPCLLAAALLALASPVPAASPKTSKPAPAKPPAGKPAAKPPARGAKKPQRMAEAKRLLNEAAQTSKNAAVKKGIADSLALVERKEFQAAEAKVGELKRTAALNGDSSTTVLKLVDAENLLARMKEIQANHQKGK